MSWFRRTTPRRATSGALGKQCLRRIEFPENQHKRHFTVLLNRRMPKRFGGGPIRHKGLPPHLLSQVPFHTAIIVRAALTLSRGLASRGNTAIRRHAARKNREYLFIAPSHFHENKPYLLSTVSAHAGLSVVSNIHVLLCYPPCPYMWGSCFVKTATLLGDCVWRSQGAV